MDDSESQNHLFFYARPTQIPAKTTLPFPWRLRARPPQHSPAFGKSPVPLTGTARPPPTPHGAGPAWQPRRSAADRGNAPGIGTAPKRRPKVAGTSRTTRGRAPHPAATPPSITKPAEGGSDPRPAALTPSRPPRPAAAPLPGPPPRSALPQRPPTKWRRLPAPLPASGAGLNACGGAGHGGGR